jgi:hypothetical protein
MKSLSVLGILTIVLLVITNLTDFSPKAEANGVGSHVTRTENYDIRIDRSEAGLAKLVALGGARRTDLSGELPTGSRFTIERSEVTGVAEVVAMADRGESLITVPFDSSRASALRRFIEANRAIFGIVESSQLVESADYTNPDGNLSFVRFEQRIDDIPVFGSEVTAGFSRKNEMFRIINNLAPAVDSKSARSDFGTPESAITRAAVHINSSIAAGSLTRVDSPRPDVLEFRSTGEYSELTAERFYFPVGNGVVRTAWRVMFGSPTSAYYVIVDAEDGALLWRANLILNQVNPSTYNVYGNGFSLMKTADSPSPFTPGCLAPTGCAQPPAVARNSFTLIGNEGPYAFNTLGWIPDTGLPVRTPPDPNITDGNNVEAGIDRVDGVNGVDPNGWAFGAPTRVFNRGYNPGPGFPPPGEEPLSGIPSLPPSEFQQGSITHGFYVINRWHDEMYRFGFTEPARNFQHFNFGRGGSEADRVSLEVQDISGTNGSNFTVAADGGRPRIQATIWTGPAPDRDGTLDSQLLVHEMTHGLTSRLIGNTTGLSSNMSAGLGEGWSDFYAIALLATTVDDPLGTHTIAGYLSYEIVPGFNSNYYYGFRRFPYTVKRSRGPNGLPHNPLTFRYMNAGCETLIGTTSTNPNSAYPRNPAFATVGNCDQIHNLGEIWATVLWEVRDQLVQRYGLGEGTRRALQYATDGMKLTPLNPTFIQARDAILSAVAVSAASDLGPVWRGFAIRGMGTGASVISAGSGSNDTVVTESFDIPLQFRRRGRVDFDADGRSDISVFRPSDRIWYLDRSFSGFAAVEWGLPTDKLVPDDYDGDGKTDFAVFRATSDGVTPDYYILRSADATVQYVSWGNIGDIPLSEDFDGDTKGDQAIFRPGTGSGQFWVLRSSDGTILLSAHTVAGVPLAGDFDGDKRGDFATYTDGFWRILRSESGYAPGFIIHFGTAGDKVVHSDYDGDGKDDMALYRPSDGTWYISQSAGGNRVQHFGISTDVPVPADYDGDGRADIGVYRNGTWYIDRSTSGILITGFGLAGDTPLPSVYFP